MTKLLINSRSKTEEDNRESHSSQYDYSPCDSIIMNVLDVFTDLSLACVVGVFHPFFLDD